MVIGFGWFGSTTIWPPSSGTVSRSFVFRPTSCLRPERVRSGRFSPRIPTKSVFFFRNGPGKPGIVRCHRSVRILPYDDVTLLGTQDMHGFGAIKAAANGFRPVADRTPDGGAVIGRHIDFEAEFAGEGDAEEARWHTAELAFGYRHMREGFRRQIDTLNEGRDDFPRLRPLHGNDSPLFGCRGEPDVEIGEFGLEIIFHVLENARRATRRRRHMEPVFGKTADNTVIIYETVFTGHDAITAAAGFQSIPGIGVDEVQELRRIRANHLDLAERGGIEHADAHAPSCIRG